MQGNILYYIRLTKRLYKTAESLETFQHEILRELGEAYEEGLRQEDMVGGKMEYGVGGYTRNSL